MHDIGEVVADLLRVAGDDWRPAAGGALAIAGLYTLRGVWRGLRRLLRPRQVSDLAQGLLSFLAREDVKWEAEESTCGVWTLAAGSAVVVRLGGRRLYQVSISGQDLVLHLLPYEQRQVAQAAQGRCQATYERERANVAHRALCHLAGVQRSAGTPPDPADQVAWGKRLAECQSRSAT